MLLDAFDWFRERPLAAAILVSLAIHAMALTLFPQLRPLKNEVPPPLSVDILQPQRNEPAPSAPQPQAAEPLPEVKPLPVPPPKRPRQNVAKVPPEMAVRQPAPAAVAPPAPQPELLTAAPEAQSQISVPAAPAPAPMLPESESAPPDPDLLNGYGHALSQAIGRHQRYPRLAQMRGWQGTTTVALKFGKGPTLLSATVHKASGHEVLDEQALEMVKDAQPFPKPPESLRNRDFTVLVPIAFRLRE